MKQSLFTIQSNEQLAEGVYKMVLAGDTSAITAPGQFVNIRLNSFFLRRPISVCDYGKNSLTIIYKTVGKGTEAMRRMKAPHKLDILTGLGNGYNTAPSGERPLGGRGDGWAADVCAGKKTARGRQAPHCDPRFQPERRNVLYGRI